jgi:hypothetical protein
MYTATSKLRLKRDGTRARTSFRVSAKRTSPFKWTWTGVSQSSGLPVGVRAHQMILTI